MAQISMSERTRLLVSGTRDVSMNPYEQVVFMRKRAGRMITHYWAKAVAVFRGREFFAEFLATFVLVVSVAFAGCLLDWYCPLQFTCKW